jgi:hypothetical protein
VTVIISWSSVIPIHAYGTSGLLAWHRQLNRARRKTATKSFGPFTRGTR